MSERTFSYSVLRLHAGSRDLLELVEPANAAAHALKLEHATMWAS
jgi:hypothetical protein